MRQIDWWMISGFVLTRCVTNLTFCGEVILFLCVCRHLRVGGPSEVCAAPEGLFGPGQSNLLVVQPSWRQKSAPGHLGGTHRSPITVIPKKLQISLLYVSLWLCAELLHFLSAVVPQPWHKENIARLLVLCGDSICRTILASKAISGHEAEMCTILAYVVLVTEMILWLPE